MTTRQKERTMLWKQFGRNTNIALFASRRIGKTWLMHELEGEAPEKGYFAIFINLEDCDSVESAVKTLAISIRDACGVEAWKQHINQRFKDIFTDANKDDDSLLKKALHSNWESLLEQSVHALSITKPKALILVDEITVCIAAICAHDTSGGTKLLRVLRSLRGQYPTINWLLTGSLGFDYLDEVYQLGGTTNDLTVFDLKAFDKETAHQYLLQTLEERGLPLLDEKAYIYLSKRLRWLTPHYLNKIVDIIESRHIEKSLSSVDKTVIKNTCDQLLTHPFNRVFNDWVAHISRHYPDDSKNIARRILDVVSEDRKGCSMDTLKAHVKTRNSGTEQLEMAIRLLSNDGYLVASKGLYSFSFGLLREYWQHTQYT